MEQKQAEAMEKYLYIDVHNIFVGFRKYKQKTLDEYVILTMHSMLFRGIQKNIPACVSLFRPNRTRSG